MTLTTRGLELSPWCPIYPNLSRSDPVKSLPISPSPMSKSKTKTSTKSNLTAWFATETSQQPSGSTIVESAPMPPVETVQDQWSTRKDPVISALCDYQSHMKIRRKKRYWRRCRLCVPSYCIERRWKWTNLSNWRTPKAPKANNTRNNWSNKNSK